MGYGEMCIAKVSINIAFFKVQDFCVGSVNLVKSFHKCWHPAKLNWGVGKGMFWGVGKIVLGTDDSQ